MILFRSPVGDDTKNPRVESIPVPDNWFTVGFDDSGWPHAKEYTEAEVGPKEPFYEHDFKGAKFIWSDDVKLDNVVLLRTLINTPLDRKSRPDFRGLTDTVPASPRRGNRNSQRPRRSPEKP